MFDGYLTFAGNEVINTSRTQAYINAGYVPAGVNVSACEGCESLWEMLGEEQPYRSPMLDEAPWYESGNADTWDFAGIIPLEVTGLTGSTRTANTTELSGDGGITSRVRFAGRTVSVSALLLGKTGCSVEAGLSWLSSVLGGTTCTGPRSAVPLGACTGDEMCAFVCCPDALDELPVPKAYPVTELIDLLDPTWQATNGSWLNSGGKLVPSPGPALPGSVANYALNPGIGTGSAAGWVSTNQNSWLLQADDSTMFDDVLQVYTTVQPAVTNGNVANLYLTGTASSTNGVPVTPGVGWTWAVDILAENFGRRLESFYLDWLDAGGNVLASTNSTPIDLPENDRIRVKVSEIPIPGAVYARLRIEIWTDDFSPAITGERVWFDNLYIGPNIDGTYVDGDMPGYYWEGGRSLSRTMTYPTPIPSARNMVKTPYPTAAVGQPTTNFSAYAQVAGSVTCNTGPDQNQNRPTVRVQAVGDIPWPTQPNLVTAGVNGTFEGGLGTGMITAGAGTTLAAESTIRHSGTGSMKVTLPTLANSAGCGTTVTGLVVGKTYQAEAWLYVPTATLSSSIRLTMGSGTAVLHAPAPVTVANTWVFASTLFTAAATSHVVYSGITGAASTAGMIFYVDDFKVYEVQNRIANPDFEGTSSTGWAGVGGGTLGVVTTPAHAGSNALRITWATVGAGAAAARYVLNGLTVGKQYTLEAWLYIPTGGANAQVNVQGFTSGNIVTVRDQWVLSTVSFVATATTHNAQIINAVAATTGQICYVDDVRFYETNRTSILGLRTNSVTNNPQLITGQTYIVSTWVRVYRHNGMTGVTCLIRDDPNNDSVAATFDPATPSTQSTGQLPVAPGSGEWIRFSWKVTMKAGRTGTGIYFYANTATPYAAGDWIDYGPMMVMAEGMAGTEPYFDGNTTGATWQGPRAASISIRATTKVPTMTARLVAPIQECWDKATWNWNAATVMGEVEVYMGAIDPQTGDVLEQTAPFTLHGNTPRTVYQPKEQWEFWQPAIWVKGGAITVDPVLTHTRYTTIEDCAQALLRSYLDVTTTSGPTVVEKLQFLCGEYALRVEWTMFVGNPYIFGPEIPLAVRVNTLDGRPDATLDPVTHKPVGSLAWGIGSSNIGVLTNAQTSCDTVQPVVPAAVVDPCCGGFKTPPSLPIVLDSCYHEASTYKRTIITVPRDYAPANDEGTLVISLLNDGKAKRGVRIRVYPDPTGDGYIGLNECDFCEEFTITYIHANDQFVIDGVGKRIYTNPSGMKDTAVNTSASVRGINGGPFDFPSLLCNMGYMLAIDVPEKYDANSDCTSDPSSSGQTMGDVKVDVSLRTATV